MKKAIFFLLNDYADLEGAYLSSQLSQDKQCYVKTASVDSKVVSIGGFRTLVDYSISKIPSDTDLLVLIGGNSWDINNLALFNTIKDRLDNNKPVAAICGAVDYLERNGLLTGFRHTGNSNYLWKNFDKYQNDNDFLEEQSTTDRCLVTANGTAPIEFTKQVLNMINFKNDSAVDKDMNLYKLGFYKYCDKYGNPFA
ncbi:DJ-1/PfpI family protein [Apilactobacillus ozensis]|uniref:DJ-1/PfpI family protein n=1 Tax=Apilactobacillus ozensis TaxID=866801 RepID=UPI00200B0A36|nr:DJ-1/PfpI family protein [Apilactobacillus ozensis]MCK8606990.1 DJ-1/PfpI family protein [Apilactobacillus ozensis]